MAGDWIKMRVDLAMDPAVIGMAEALDVDEDLVVGKLHRLWSWADSQSRDGHVTTVTQKWIDRYVKCDGFARAMESVRWIAFDATGITFPNFEKHNGETAKARAQGSKRQQKHRGKATATRVTQSSRTRRDKNVTREEKRREEKNTDSKKEREISTAHAKKADRKPMALHAYTAESAAIAAWCRKQPKKQSESAFESAFEAYFQKTWSQWSEIKRLMEPNWCLDEGDSV